MRIRIRIGRLGRAQIRQNDQYQIRFQCWKVLLPETSLIIFSVNFLGHTALSRVITTF
jgi:hypothetical protein